MLKMLAVGMHCGQITLAHIEGSSEATYWHTQMNSSITIALAPVAAVLAI
jgi:hypothetical protein